MLLTVLGAYDHDVYKDMARIHISHRGPVKRNGLARVAVTGGKPVVLVLRGMEPIKRDYIRLDIEVRERLNVVENSCYDFIVEPASAFDHLIWAMKSSEPALRIATAIAIWSFGLGILGVVLGVVPFFTK
jgi:hypothetical protein